METPVPIDDLKLLQKFKVGGFSALINDETARLSKYFEMQAVETGSAAHVFVSQALQYVHGLFMDDDQGVQVSFLTLLDRLAVAYMVKAKKLTDLAESAKLAHQFKMDIASRISTYGPGVNYD